MNRILKAMAAIMLMMVFAVGCTKPECPNNGGNNNGQNDSIVNPNNNGENDSIADNSGTLNGHDFVDLGLPSGTLWATCNVGAEKPQGYGDYFAWGEVQPKANYNLNTYEYCVGDYHLIKYCNNTSFGYQGFIDNLIVIQPEDDAATINWGIGWHTPTKVEWEELYQNTMQLWVVQNGVNGRKFTDSKGNGFFLPAAGFCWDSVPSEVGNKGYYWSSSLDIAYPSSAWVFGFDSNDYEVGAGSRYGGRVIRPVCSPNK